MKIKIAIIMLTLVIATSLACYSEDLAASAVDKYNNAGYSTPTVSVVYVDKFSKESTVGTISGDTILIRKDAEDKDRIIAHEMAHIITLDLIEGNKDAFEAYRWQRIGTYRPVNVWRNLTADEANLKIQWYMWYWYSLDVRELVAEDLRYSIYGGPTMLDYTIGPPDSEQISILGKLIKGGQ